MVIQDIKMGIQVIYEAKNAVIIGDIIGAGQRKCGTRIVMIETTGQQMFIADLQHVHPVDALRAL